MRALAQLGGIVLMAVILAACDADKTITEPGVSLQLARERAERLANIHYTLWFEIPAQEQDAIHARASISFDLVDAAQPLQLDFAGTDAGIHSLRSNGAVADYRFSNEHIVLPASILRAGRNEVEIEFVAGSGSLNRNPEYLYSLLVPDRARTVFPLFDQPDLKARFELTLAVPAGWLAMSNAPALAVRQTGGK